MTSGRFATRRDTFSREEMGPMIMAWGRNRPVRCPRCASYAVGASLTGEAATAGARPDRLVLALSCGGCGRRGESSIAAPP